MLEISLKRKKKKRKKKEIKKRGVDCYFVVVSIHELLIRITGFLCCSLHLV